MSRSNPSDSTPNPCQRWFEWNGETGVVRYYDKTAKQNVEVGDRFSFLLLDQLATVQGWHEPSQSGIYANEVRDTRQDVLVVKAFKLKGPLAEGLYRDIKDRVNVAGGQFVANCYIGFKQGDGLALGSIRFKGAALSAWMDFSKAHRADLYTQAIEIDGYTEGKKGRIVFRVPVLKIKDLSQGTHEAALDLDAVLQEYLTHYLKRTKREQVEHVAQHAAESEPEYEAGRMEPPSDDEIPF